MYSGPLACTGKTCWLFSSWFPLWISALQSAGRTSGTSSRKPWRSSCSFSVRCGVPPTRTGGLSFHRQSSLGPVCVFHFGLESGSWNRPLLPFLKRLPCAGSVCRNRIFGGWIWKPFTVLRAELSLQRGSDTCKTTHTLSCVCPSP